MKLLRPQDGDTICALATPPGEGALALLRVSGKNSFQVLKKLCPFLTKKKLLSHHVYFGTLTDPVQKKPVDEVLVTYFQKGRSFTGEESFEISCHGGAFLSSLILDLLIRAGARMAEKGEFSYRAFMQGRIDLVQAESILSLIQSRSEKAHRQAIAGLKGSVSKYLETLEKDLLKLMSHLEAEIDFSEQDISVFSAGEKEKTFLQVRQKLKKALAAARVGRQNRKGFTVVLCGAPNAGKSSLFNHLLQEEKAIITDAPGTTRDLLSERVFIEQREFCVQDTAGLRLAAAGRAEKAGIQKTWEAMEEADLVLFLLEATLSFSAKNCFGLSRIKKEFLQKTCLVFSKADKLNKKQRAGFLNKVYSCLKSGLPPGFLKKNRVLKSSAAIPSSLEKPSRTSPLWISVRTKEGISGLKKLFFQKSETTTPEVFLFSLRQEEGLKKMERFLNKARRALKQGAGSELIALELQAALMVLYQLLGKEYNEEVIQQIFKEFCIGK